MSLLVRILEQEGLAFALVVVEVVALVQRGIVPPQVDSHHVIGAAPGLHHDDEGDGLVGQEGRVLVDELGHRVDDEPTGLAVVHVGTPLARRAVERPVRVELVELVAVGAVDVEAVLPHVLLAVIPVGVGVVGRREVEVEGLVEAGVLVGRERELRDGVPAGAPRVLTERDDLGVDVGRAIMLTGVVGPGDSLRHEIDHRVVDGVDLVRRVGDWIDLVLGAAGDQDDQRGREDELAHGDSVSGDVGIAGIAFPSLLTSDEIFSEGSPRHGAEKLRRS